MHIDSFLLYTIYILYIKIANSGLTPRNGTYTFSDGLTYGLSKTDAGSVSLEIGYKMTIKAGDGILPAETTHEISSKLTGTYSHAINVTEKHTQIQTHSIFRQYCRQPINLLSPSFPLENQPSS